MRNIFRFAAALAFVLCASGVSYAAAPSNDNWSDRTIIGELPFSDSVANVRDATTESTDPDVFCWWQSSIPAGPGNYSVWYGFTTGDTDEYVDLDTSGYDTVMAVYEGQPNGFVGVRGGCNDDGQRGGSGSILRGLRLRANTSYSIVVVRQLSGGSALTLNFSMSRSAVYRVSKTADGNDGVCDEDCSLREAVAQSIAQPGAVLVPSGHYVIPGGLNFGDQNPGGGNLYGAGIDETIIDAAEEGRVVTYPTQEGSGKILTFGLHDLTVTKGVSGTKGGGIYLADGYLVLDRVAVTHSVAQAGNGGGVAIEFGAASIYESLVSDNRAVGSGGGVYMFRYNLEIRDSTFSANQALAPSSTGRGGGLFVENMYDLNIVNTTISGNRAFASGGGAYLKDVWGGEVNNATIVDNTFYETATVSRAGGLLLDAVSGTVVRNSALAGNHVFGQPDNLSDCERISQSVMTGTYSLVQVPGSCTFPVPGNLIGVDPQLSPLGLYGSLVPVHVPIQGSPLIDAGDPGEGSCASLDARGVKRPLDGDGDGSARCDIGATEFERIDDSVFADGFDSSAHRAGDSNAR